MRELHMKYDPNMQTYSETVLGKTELELDDSMFTRSCHVCWFLGTIKKYLIICIFLFFTSCFSRSSYNEQYCDEWGRCVTIIQYHNFSDPLLKGHYIVNGKHNGKIPKENYVFIEHSQFPVFFIRWEDETLIVRCPSCIVIENLIDDPIFDFKKEFTEEEKIEYHYYNGKDDFNNSLRKNFKIIGFNSFKKNWGLSWTSSQKHSI